MRLILTGGGTGGHIYPNIAIIEEVSKSISGSDILYVGSKNGMEKEIIEDNGIAFKGIHCGKLRRYFSLRTAIDFMKIPLGFLESIYIISKFKPDVVFSKGGYVSVPLLAAAKLMKKRIIIHESDSIPGLATKISAHFADKICLAYREAEKCFNNKSFVLTGIPIRKSFRVASKEKGFEISGFTNKKPVILVFGGSLGAKFINELIVKNIDKITKFAQVIHITGKGKQISIKNADYKSFENLGDDLRHIYAISDLIISRAGANSIAEIESLGICSILIPLGLRASRGDQISNARILAENHACIKMDEEKIIEDQFILKLEDLIRNKEKREKISQKAKTELHVKAARKISDLITQNENRN